MTVIGSGRIKNNKEISKIPAPKPETVYQFLGARVREERKRLGLTQEELSERADITPNFVCHIERGTKQATLFTICKLTQALGITLDDLFSTSMRYLNPPDKLASTKQIAQLLLKCTPHQKKQLTKILKLILKLAK